MNGQAEVLRRAVAALIQLVSGTSIADEAENNPATGQAAVRIQSPTNGAAPLHDVSDTTPAVHEPAARSF
jgi:hypothetical protein